MAKTRSVSVLIIDDTAEDRTRVEGVLKGLRGLRVKAVPPPAQIDVTSVVQSNPDAILVDYQLNATEPERQPATYKGSTLAAALREKLPEVPILVLTRRQLVTTGRAAGARDVSSAFDELWVKESLYKDPRGFAADLLTLVRGYRALAKASARDWSALRKVFGAQPEEEDLLLSADPPPEIREDKRWRVSEVARWVRGTLLKYPGILYDALHASVAIGLTSKSFLRPRVQQFFAAAAYAGPFASPSSHWWKQRLLLRSRELLTRAGMADASLGRFAEAWRKERHQGLDLAACCASREKPADSICHVLSTPVLRRYSLPYHPDSRPAVMDEARVSFKAIRETNDYDDRKFPPDARSLLRDIQRGDD